MTDLHLIASQILQHAHAEIAARVEGKVHEDVAEYLRSRGYEVRRTERVDELAAAEAKLKELGDLFREVQAKGGDDYDITRFLAIVEGKREGEKVDGATNS